MHLPSWRVRQRNWWISQLVTLLLRIPRCTTIPWPWFEVFGTGHCFVQVPKNIFSPSLTLDDVDEEEIARQLTLIEYEVSSYSTAPRQSVQLSL